MDKFQDLIGKLVLPGNIIDRKYGTTCDQQRFCIVTTHMIWYNVFVVIELDENDENYKIVNITKQLVQNGAKKEAEKFEKIKSDKKKLKEVLEMEDYQN
jgi:hypothetical protein